MGTERQDALEIEDKLLAEMVKELLDPYRRWLTAEEQMEMAQVLSDSLATNPVQAELFEQLLPARVVQQSGTVGKGDEASDDEDLAKIGS